MASRAPACAACHRALLLGDCALPYFTLRPEDAPRMLHAECFARALGGSAERLVAAFEQHAATGNPAHTHILAVYRALRSELADSDLRALYEDAKDDQARAAPAAGAYAEVSADEGEDEQEDEDEQEGDPEVDPDELDDLLESARSLRADKRPRSSLPYNERLVASLR